MSAKSGKPIMVLFGSISVLIGATLGKYIKPELIRYIGASLFTVIGILMFLDKRTT